MLLSTPLWTILGTVALAVTVVEATASRTVIDAAQLKAVVQERQFRPNLNGRRRSPMLDSVTKFKRQDDSGSCPP